MACLRSLSTLGLLLACSSPSVESAPTREKAAPLGVTSRAMPGHAAVAPPDRLANYDARSAEAARGAPALRTGAFEWAGPAGSRAGAASAVAGPPRTAVEAARAFLGLSASRVAGLAAPTGGAADETVVTGVHDTGRGPVIVQLKRRVAGLDVYGQTTAVVLTRDLVPVARSGAAVAADRVAQALRAFALDPVTAMAAALSDLTGQAYGAGDLATVESRGGYDRAQLAAGNARSERLISPARARKVLFPLVGDLVPAYQVEVALRQPTGPLQAFAYVISADDGAVLVRRNQVQSDYSYTVWADPTTQLPHDGPQGLAGTPHPTGLPDGFQPGTVPQSTVTLNSFPFSRNDPWLDGFATTASGNNAHAYIDGAGGVVEATPSAGAFSTVYDFGSEPDTASNQQAAIAQLFYDVNFFHDWYYDSGFDEASGNAQAGNFGRGGLGGDPLMAEGQDYEGYDNANMYTPADGSSPIMQMYLFHENGRRWIDVSAPDAAAGTYEAQTATFGQIPFDLSGTLAVAAPATACDALIGSNLVGKIALVDRGDCDFSVKAQNVEDAGAIGVIIRNVDSSQDFGWMAPGEGYAGGVTIPVLLVPVDTGAALGRNWGTDVKLRMVRDAAPMRDGTVDNLIVAHEWGHYISNRLVGNGGGLADLQAGGLGEGWGDTHAMLLAVRPEDALVPADAGFGGVYALAGWTMGGEDWNTGGNQGLYFGVRRVPYSTDMTKDPLTFRHIADGQPLVPAGSTIPVAFGADGEGNSEVHNAGEVWATMLWECYAALLRDTLGTSPRLTFQQAQDRWKDYLVAAYKLTPTNPTFLEARDALLAVARAGDLRDYQLFWQAFAKRGAGVNAIGPGKWTSFDNNPVVESFEADPHFSVVSATFQSSTGTCSDGDAYLDLGERGAFTVQLRNDGVSALPATQAVASGTGLSFPSTPVAVPASSVGDVVSVTVPVSLTKLPSGSDATFALAFAATSTTVAFTTQVPAKVNRDVLASSSIADSFEEPDLIWTVDGTFEGQAGWRLSADGAWAEGTNGTSDLRLVSPDLVVGTQPLTVTITHRYLFDTADDPVHPPALMYFDGGVVEISTDGGVSWADVGASAYDGSIADLGGLDPSPLAGRAGFTYANAHYPDFDTSKLVLGTAYAGRHVRFRFRMGSDMSVGWGGWTVRSVEFAGITNRPFPLVRADAGKCASSAGGGSGGGGGGCATGGGGSAGAALLLAAAMLAVRLRRRRAGA